MTLSQALDLIRQRQGVPRKRKIALLCGFEALHLGTFLLGSIAQRFEDVCAELKTGLYGDLEGSLAAASGWESEAAVLVLEWSTLDSRLGLRSSGGWGLSVQQDILDSCRQRFARLRSGLEALASTMPLVVAPPTLPVVLLGHTPGGRLSQTELDLQRQLAAFLAEASGIAGVSVLNPTRLDILSPAAARSDPRMELNAGFPYSLGHASALAGQIAEALFPRAPMKGLITDLDGTLWSGIVGEVGVEGVSWSLSAHSQIHGLYQQLLRHFSEIGVLLAIASKNELRVVKEALLREDLYIPGAAFYPVRADWGAKSRHIAKILGAWNIGPDSVVFVDDSPMELDEVRTAFPSITCLQFPAKQPAAAVALFSQLRDLFGKSAVNAEDALRRASIQAGEVFRESAGNLDNSEFLRSLKGRVIFDNRKQAVNQRLLELINKTNQFNLNGVRISEGEWLRHLADPACFVCGISYEDKLGPLGVIGVVAGKQIAGRLEILTWVMSCRAFSRRIEFHTLQQLFESSGADSISVAFKATERNPPLQEFLSAIGLAGDGVNGWVLPRDQFIAGKYELPHRVSTVSEPSLGANAEPQAVGCADV